MAVMHLIRVIFSLLCSLACFAAFATFMFFKNYPSAVFSLLAGFLNGMLTHLQLLNYKKKLNAWYDPVNLKQISQFGFYCFAMSVSMLTYFAVVEIMTKKPIMPIDESVILPIIWTILSLKSGISLYFYADSYSRQDETRLLDDDPSATTVDDSSSVA